MDNEDPQKSPFQRPGFLLAAAVIAVIVLLGIVVAIVQVNKPEPAAETAPVPATTAAAQPGSSEAAPAPTDGSVCALKQGKLDGTLSKAPTAEWKYLGASAYPSSAVHGPGATADEGYLYCFQRSPEGAVFAAANAAVQGGQPNADRWMDYFIADTPGRTTALREAENSSKPSGDRLQIQGFRLLSYTGDEATVDVAFRVTPDGQSAVGSMVYDLRWEDGDWKVVVQDNGQLNMEPQLIPDLAGYVSWRE